MDINGLLLTVTYTVMLVLLLTLVALECAIRQTWKKIPFRFRKNLQLQEKKEITTNKATINVENSPEKSDDKKVFVVDDLLKQAAVDKPSRWSATSDDYVMAENPTAVAEVQIEAFGPNVTSVSRTPSYCVPRPSTKPTNTAVVQVETVHTGDLWQDKQFLRRGPKKNVFSADVRTSIYAGDLHVVPGCSLSVPATQAKPIGRSGSMVDLAAARPVKTTFLEQRMRSIKNKPPKSIGSSVKRNKPKPPPIEALPPLRPRPEEQQGGAQEPIAETAYTFMMPVPVNQL